MQWYRQAPGRAFNKEIDFDSDALTFTLHTSAYAPNLDTHANVSDLTNELATGSGYTVGGVAAGSLTRTTTAANSWSTARASTTAYALDDVVRPAAANGFLYRAAVAGTTSGGVLPYPTVVGTTLIDGTVTWECVGRGILVLACASPSWAGASFTFRYAVLSDRSTGVAATEPLVGLTDFGSDQTGLGGPFTINVSPSVPGLGVLYVPIP